MEAMMNAAESFLYIWYDTKNKKYYLGKHKGTPDDSYTHSSTIMESFNKDNTPSYMKRRILAYGTDEEMCILEHECLKNRKEKKWDRYHNVYVGDPRYVDQSGENNHMYKHGLSHTPEYRKENYKEWRKKNRNKVKEYYDAYHEQYYKKNKDKILKRQKEYRESHIDKVKETQRRYYLKHRDKILKTEKAYRARKKAERLASGATLPI